jgi:hypothetical protein
MTRLFPDEPEPKSVTPNQACRSDCEVQWPWQSALDEYFCTRMFFMVLNKTIPTPNTSSYIWKADAKWCENLEAIAGYNWWCIIVFDNLCNAGRQWALCRRFKKDKPPILGCSIFLIVSYCYYPNTFHLLLGHTYNLNNTISILLNLIPFIIYSHRSTILTT